MIFEDSEQPFFSGSPGEVIKNPVFLMLIFLLLAAACLPFPLVYMMERQEAKARSEAGAKRPPTTGAGSAAAPGETGSDDSDSSPKAQKNPVQELVSWLRDSNYKSIEETSTGRFLADIEEKSLLVQQVDVSGAHLTRRGKRSVFVEAPYGPAGESQGTVELRLVMVKNQWMLENLEILETEGE